MAFNPVEYLEQGKIDFLFNRLGTLDTENLIKRVRNSSNKINIINGFLPKLKKISPHFCFAIIYDTDEFVEETFNLVKGKYTDIGEFHLPKDLENFIEKVAVWYELRYPNYEINRIMPGSSQELKHVNKEMFLITILR